MNPTRFDRDEPWQNEDDVVRGTNDDATISRMSAASLGYIDDPFVQFFVKKPIRRPPIINRGSYIRNQALNNVVQQFLQSDIASSKKQIVSLGAGFDTRYFLLKSGKISVPSVKFKYFEIDFPEMITKKASIIRRKTELATMLESPTVERGGMELGSADYALIGGDLRHWDSIAERLRHHGLQPDIPTLFISECVLIYLAPEDSQIILKWITENVSSCLFLLYEQILPDDAFGKVMIRNLKLRNIELKGIHAYPTLDTQIQRFKDLNWYNAHAVDINTLHDQRNSQEEIKRISQLELLDELEEWRLLAAHYCVALASKNSNEEVPDIKLL
ncbi:leucine carboxyl methyltransferase 1 [Umbelopsis sp. PMI_123]|nr:leucine carboxyl methyltransferase 1 [Umbelopsis sp. PMI_123]